MGRVSVRVGKICKSWMQVWKKNSACCMKALRCSGSVAYLAARCNTQLLRISWAGHVSVGILTLSNTRV